jgi:predicted secreted protein
MHHWRFRCHAAGEGRIAAASRRTWEKAGSAGRTFDLTIKVSL